MLARIYRNHVPANLTFLLVLAVGIASYMMMPREQDPTINFNWIDVTTVMPGASAEDIETRVTDILEDAVRKVQDIKFVSSNSRESVSSILVRFDDIDERTFDKRLADLRREIQNRQDELPTEADDPIITEITTANAYPTATLVVKGPADDENLRRQAELVKNAVERIPGVDTVLDFALHDPELQVNFHPRQLENLRVLPTDIANTVSLYYRDTSAGTAQVGEQSWLVRMQGTRSDPDWLASLPVLTARGEVRLDALADVVRGRDRATRLVQHDGQPGVLMGITKQAGANTLDLVEQIQSYIDDRNQLSDQTGVTLVMVDDQTEITRNALNIMQTNAALGLLLVLVVAFAFLGARIALLTAAGIPFVLAGTFWLLGSWGMTLNVMVLLGVVISLGMLVDVGVVIAEGIYYRLQRGQERLEACVATLSEVGAPLTAAVLTTMAAFLPLMLLPGILGKFMFVVPAVVTTALALSLVAAFWILPSHVQALRVSFANPSRIGLARERALKRIRSGYVRVLVRALRWPKTVLLATVLTFVLAVGSVAAGFVRVDFFAFDPLRLFYVNVEMPSGTPLERSMDVTAEVERIVRSHIDENELRNMVSYAGLMFTETAPFQGDQYGQVQVALLPKVDDNRDVDDIIDAMREEVESVAGPERIFFVRLSGGPPVTKPVSVKVRGDDFAEIRAAASDLQNILRGMAHVFDIADDDTPGQPQLMLSVNHDTARRAGIDPQIISRTVRLLVDGEVVASMQDQGQRLEVRVQARRQPLSALDDLLAFTLPSADGRRVALADLVHARTRQGAGNLRHYNFRRAITVEADIDRSVTDTVTVNNEIMRAWDNVASRYPDIDLDFTGELDDIQESLNAIYLLFLVGIGLIYLIIGTQFGSYMMPLMILVTVPMAFTGVVMGLLASNNPLSLYTLYGVVALAGIAVNSAIVLITAANDRLGAGMSVLHSIVYAARRRVIPILITATTTIAGLFALATGLGGRSLLWGPVATAIVWGLVVSTILTLFVVPIMYRTFVRAPKSA